MMRMGRRALRSFLPGALSVHANWVWGKGEREGARLFGGISVEDRWLTEWIG